MDYSTYGDDFTSEGRAGVYAFSYILGYSASRQYLHFVESPGLRHDHLPVSSAASCAPGGRGGVPRLYDNMKVVVTGYDGDEPI